MMREGLEAITATGSGVGLQDFLCVMAQACGSSGEPREGLYLLERGIRIAEAGAKYRLPELLRVKGELLLRIDPGEDAAEDWFQQAMTMAREQGTKTLLLRAAVSLGRRYLEFGSVQKTRDLLSPIYEAFPEGFDTRDLIEAKGLLDR